MDDLFNFISNDLCLTSQIMGQIATFSHKRLLGHSQLTVYLEVDPLRLFDSSPQVADLLMLRGTPQHQISMSQQCALMFHSAILQWLETQADSIQSADLPGESQTICTRFLLERNFTSYFTSTVIKPSYIPKTLINSNQSSGWIEVMCGIEAVTYEGDTPSMAELLNNENVLSVNPTQVMMRVLTSDHIDIKLHIGTMLKGNFSLVSDFTSSIDPHKGHERSHLITCGQFLSKLAYIGSVVRCVGVINWAIQEVPVMHVFSASSAVSDRSAFAGSANNEVATAPESTGEHLEESFWNARYSWLQFIFSRNNFSPDDRAFASILASSGSLNAWVAAFIASHSATIVIPNLSTVTDSQTYLPLKIFVECPSRRCEEAFMTCIQEAQSVAFTRIADCAEFSEPSVVIIDKVPNPKYFIKKQTKVPQASNDMSAPNNAHSTHLSSVNKSSVCLKAGAYTGSPQCLLVPRLQVQQPSQLSKYIQFLKYKGAPMVVRPKHADSIHPAAGRQFPTNNTAAIFTYAQSLTSDKPVQSSIKDIVSRCDISLQISSEVDFFKLFAFRDILARLDQEHSKSITVNQELKPPLSGVPDITLPALQILENYFVALRSIGKSDNAAMALLINITLAHFHATSIHYPCESRVASDVDAVVAISIVDSSLAVNGGGVFPFSFFAECLKPEFAFVDFHAAIGCFLSRFH